MGKSSSQWITVAVIGLLVVGGAVYFGNTKLQKGTLRAIQVPPISVSTPSGLATKLFNGQNDLASVQIKTGAYDVAINKMVFQFSSYGINVNELQLYRQRNGENTICLCAPSWTVWIKDETSANVQAGNTAPPPANLANDNENKTGKIIVTFNNFDWLNANTTYKYFIKGTVSGASANDKFSSNLLGDIVARAGNIQELSRGYNFVWAPEDFQTGKNVPGLPTNSLTVAF